MTIRKIKYNKVKSKKHIIKLDAEEFIFGVVF